jgi:IS30 family transposase
VGRYRAHLAEQVHAQWADDTISLHHREHVARLVDVERNLNERIAHLRRSLADPEASSEDAHRKRQGEVNRSIIGRLVKFRKKERLQAQMATKIQRRHHKARAAVASKAATTDEDFVE